MSSNLIISTGTTEYVKRIVKKLSSNRHDQLIRFLQRTSVVPTNKSNRNVQKSFRMVNRRPPAILVTGWQSQRFKSSRYKQSHKRLWRIRSMALPKLSYVSCVVYDERFSKVSKSSESLVVISYSKKSHCIILIQRCFQSYYKRCVWTASKRTRRCLSSGHKASEKATKTFCMEIFDKP